ncbi:ATP-binding cassette domain-containing protein [Marinobacter fonticola]|uniref:ATP-binding cassette domain-containing protein n=1 Tax=Marinobacter fonticola TaxID=2603215 RepID=UPI0011E87E5B|nr:ATP-binding cassette domain-containing protein [Marinobacter fonticola]
MLDVSQLRFGYPEARQSFEFNVQVALGTCLAVTGPSGCGKTTLLSLLAGFLTPESGRIQWRGKDLTDLSPWDRPVTSVFQEHNLFNHLNVRDNLALGLHPGMKITANDEKRIADLLETIGLFETIGLGGTAELGSTAGLGGMARRYPSELSGGQRQRVAVARALLRDTPLLLLDEPFTGLDSETRKRLHDLLLRQKANGTTLILVSHDPDDVAILSDHTLSLTNG